MWVIVILTEYFSVEGTVTRVIGPFQSDTAAHYYAVELGMTDDEDDYEVRMLTAPKK